MAAIASAEPEPEPEQDIEDPVEPSTLPSSFRFDQNNSSSQNLLSRAGSESKHMERLSISGDEEKVSHSNDKHHLPDTCTSCHNKASMVRDMDPKVWSSMPEHIFDHVLAFLPFWSILQLQCVSRKWKDNLMSPNFLEDWGKKSPPEVLFVMYTDCWQLKVAAAYSPSLDKWHLIPFNGEEIAHDLHIITTAGGLLCTEEVAWPNRSLIVCNPINGSYRRLPPMLDMKSPYVVGMAVDADKRGYRVLVAQDGESLVSQYYDSKSDSWKMNTTLNSRVAMLVGMATLGGSLFCLSFWPIGLIAYNIEEATWCDLQVKMPASISSPHLIHHNEQLVLVGGVEEYGQMTSIRIWKLDLASKECLEIEQMPGHLFEKFSWTVGGEHFSCTGEAGFICFNDGLTPPILMYSMNEKRWWWLPPCPLHISSPKTRSKYALNPLGFPIKPCFLEKA